MLKHVGMVSVALSFLAIGAMSPSSEVVNLTTQDEAGQPQTTPLWVVERDGVQWLRGGPDSGWVGRLQVNPEVELERGGSSQPYRAVPHQDPENVVWINRAMAEKYGVSDSMVSLWADKQASLAIRLDSP